MVLIIMVLILVFAAALLAIPAVVLWLLLGLLAWATGWTVVALNFWACYAIVAILSLFGSACRR